MEENNKPHGSGVKHVYDGIVEENNPMPAWWIWLFIGTIIFSALYYLHYEVGGGQTLKQEYETAFKSHMDSHSGAATGGSADTEESLAVFAKNEAHLLAGAKIFAEKCAMCHGNDLEGKIGPNLTDKYWIFGKGSFMDIHHTIAKGSAAKGMPPWEGLLKPDELRSVVAFVHSKIGSNPANPKAPDGTEVK